MDNKIKDEYNQPKYERVLNCNYYQVIRFRNKWVITDLNDDGIDNVDYEHINITTFHGNFTNMLLVIPKGNYGAIDDEYTSFHGYYIIRFTLTPYILQQDLNIHR